MLRKIKELACDDVGLFLMSVVVAVMIGVMAGVIVTEATNTYVTVRYNGRHTAILVDNNMTLSGIQKIDTDTGCQVVVEFKEGEK